MDRRAAMITLALGAFAGSTRAQAPLPRVVFASNRDPENGGPFLDRFRAGMREQGYVEDRNYVLDVRYAWNDQSRIAPMIKESLASGPALLVVSGLYAARVARDATKTIPIVVATGSDLVESGIVKSYAKPGGNITGVADLTDEAAVKRLEYVRAALPKARRIALITNPDFPATPRVEKKVRAAAADLGVPIMALPANDRTSLLAAIDSLPKAQVDAILMGGDNNAVSHSQLTISRATAIRIPIAYFWPGTAEMGAIFSYQADVLGNFERAASHAARILKGAKPGDLPIELPKAYELVVNRKAATALGISLPTEFVIRAHRVID
jgi:ABC-type uncharacterized transport system substrate-binding protein